MSQQKLYVLDTNVLIHDPESFLNFHEHDVAIPMTVLEELDHIKSGPKTVAADCRHAIRKLDDLIGEASLEEITAGVPIPRADGCEGRLLILRGQTVGDTPDDRIIAHALAMETKYQGRVVLVTKDINMRLKAKGAGLLAEDYHSDRAIDDMSLLSTGYIDVPGSFWDGPVDVQSRQDHSNGDVVHTLPIPEALVGKLHLNQFIVDEAGFVGLVLGFNEVQVTLRDLPRRSLMNQEAWGLKPRDIYQAIALYALLDPNIHLVNLTGAAGSGKTILALAAAIEQTMVSKTYRRIIATRSVQGLDEDIGFLPGTEAEKMGPWLGAITDNLEALHIDDEDSDGSIDYLLQRVPLQFKSLNYIRGRSFQHTILLIDECQNLTPHQMKTIITRAGTGTKVVCLGNLAQIDTPYLSAPSSGLTYLTQRFQNFPNGAHIGLRGVPRSVLAEYAESHL